MEPFTPTHGGGRPGPAYGLPCLDGADDGGPMTPDFPKLLSPQGGGGNAADDAAGRSQTPSAATAEGAAGGAVVATNIMGAAGAEMSTSASFAWSDDAAPISRQPSDAGVAVSAGCGAPTGSPKTAATHRRSHSPPTLPRESVRKSVLPGFRAPSAGSAGRRSTTSTSAGTRNQLSPSPSSARSAAPKQDATASKRDGLKGDISMCVRLRPGSEANDFICAAVEGSNCVRLSPHPTLRSEMCEAVYQCDHALGPDTSQEQVFSQAVAPICDAVMRGYNGAVIAYGQTGSGKTHTMLGDTRGEQQGVTPRALQTIFAALAHCAAWHVEVTVLEIYNERVRDLLAPSSSISTVDIHEVCMTDHGSSFRCTDATTWAVNNPEDALDALTVGMRRRETARTDMNHTSSRSHLIFTLCITQNDHEVGATLRSRLHLVDLAGSERLKRSMATDSAWRGPLSARGQSKDARPPGGRTPRDQRREAGEINKSLSQLALVIQRLTTHGNLQYVPYRDSMLTRLLAESFGGSSKTCLIIACSALGENREETRSSLEFGKRAKLVRNRAEINLEVETEPSEVVKALVAMEVAQLQRERDAILAERDALLCERPLVHEWQERAERMIQEAAAYALGQQEQRATEVRQLEEEKAELQWRREESAALAEDVQEQLSRELVGLQEEKLALHKRLQDSALALARLEADRDNEVRKLDGECSTLRHQLEVEAEERARIGEENARRVAALLEEQASLQRTNIVMSEEVLRLQEEEAARRSKLEEEKLEVYSRWREDVSRLEEDKAALAQRLEEEKMALHRRLEEVAYDASRFQDDKAAMALRMQEERTALSRRMQDEVLAIREEKAYAVAALEEEKLALHRRGQEDAVKTQEARAAAIAELEREKGVLRRKWQDALEDARRLQGEQAALETRLEEERAELAMTFEAEKAEIHRQCRLELTQVLEGKVAEVSTLEMDRLALHRRLDEDKARFEQEQAAAAMRLEADNLALHQRLHECASDATRLHEENAALVARLEGDAAAARSRWRDEFSEQLAQMRSAQAKQLSQLEGWLADAGDRRHESETNVARFQDELIALQCQLQQSQQRPQLQNKFCSAKAVECGGSGQCPATAEDCPLGMSARNGSCGSVTSFGAEDGGQWAEKQEDGDWPAMPTVAAASSASSMATAATVAATRRAEQDGATLLALLAERRAELERSRESTMSDAAHLEGLRRARFADLEAAAAELQRKWWGTSSGEGGAGGDLPPPIAASPPILAASSPILTAPPPLTAAQAAVTAARWVPATMAGDGPVADGPGHGVDGPGAYHGPDADGPDADGAVPDPFAARLHPAVATVGPAEAQAPRIVSLDLTC